MKRKIIAFAEIFAIAFSLFGFTSCDKIQYTVTFDSDGGSEIQPVKVFEGGYVDEPVTFMDGEYRLVGWYNGNVRWDFYEDKVTSDINLKAKWISGYTDGLDYILSDDESSYIVSGFGEAEKSYIVIPSFYRGLPVSGIAENSFYGCGKIVSVWMPDSVKFIGSHAFSDCEYLKGVKMSASLISTGDYAFSDCKRLKSINIPEGVSVISDYIFEGCKSLSSVDIPSGVTYFGKACFSSCEKITNITIPEGVAYIGDNAFYGCISLEEIYVPESVTELGDGVFTGCTSLKTANINADVIFSGKSLFSGCFSLENVTFSSSVCEIEYKVFYGCKALKSLYLSENIDVIGDYAFDKCGIESLVYGGTNETWGNVVVGKKNDALKKVSLTFENREPIRD